MNETGTMKNSFLMLVCFGFLLPVFSTVGQADSGLATGGKLMAYADKLFDNSRVHRIDVRLSDADLSGLLADPISRTEYAADIVIDGETFSDVVFSTKGFSSLYFVAYGEEESAYKVGERIHDSCMDRTKKVGCYNYRNKAKAYFCAYCVDGKKSVQHDF
jgi:spore coat protein CotH